MEILRFDEVGGLADALLNQWLHLRVGKAVQPPFPFSHVLPFRMVHERISFDQRHIGNDIHIVASCRRENLFNVLMSERGLPFGKRRVLVREIVSEFHH